MPLLMAAVALLGLAIGSFLNVVIHRVPLELSLSRPSSRCPSCQHPIRRRHNIPVLGWLLLRGRCADCAAPISVRYPLVELLMPVLFMALAWRLDRLHLLPALPAYLFFAAVGISLTLIDLDLKILPNAIVLPSYPVLGLLLTIAAVQLDQPAALVRAGICGLALYGFYFLLVFAYPAGMGFGDVKLAGVIGGVLGFLSYSAALIGAFGAFLIGGVLSMLLLATGRATRKSAIPFGPFMILAAVLAIFAGAPITGLYSSLVLAT